MAIRDASWDAGLSLVLELRRAGHSAYLVGGCVRDRLLGRPIRDVDIATSATPDEVAALFGDVIPTGLKHGTVTVRRASRLFEVTTYRTESGYSDARHPDEVRFVRDVREDLARRDFTINAMAAGPDGELVDPYGGKEDLRAGVIRCVGRADERFEEDALRMLRAIRFAAEYGFRLAPSAWKGLRRQAHRLRRIAMERVGAELDKMTAGSGPDRAWRLLPRSGLLRCAKEPIPALDGLSGCRDGAVAGFGRGADMLAALPRLADPDARWAALLIGAGAGEGAAAAACRALRFSRRRTARIAAVCGLRAALIAGEGGAAAPTDGEPGRRRWVAAVLAHGRDAAERWLAIRRACAEAGGSLPEADGAADADWRRQARWLTGMSAFAAEDLAVKGDDLVRWSGRKPGPWVAEALRELLHRAACGDVANAREPLKRWFADNLAKREGSE